MSLRRRVLFILFTGTSSLAGTPVEHAALPFAAATTGDIPTLRAALDAGAEINSCDAEGNTALILAARAGQAETVKFLLNRGAAVRLDTSPDPVSSALEHGNPEIAQDILAFLKTDKQPPKAPVLSQNDELSLAIIAGDQRTIEKLVTTDKYKNYDVMIAAIQLARQHGRLAIEQYLVIANEPAAERHDSWLKTGNELASAVEAKDYRKADGLLARGADPNFIKDSGRSILHYAMDTGDVSFVRLVMRYHADPLQESTKLRRQLPLWQAAKNNNFDMAQELVTGRETRQQLGMALYIVVSNKDCADFAHFLLTRGADPNFAHDDGTTVLRRARAGRDPQVVPLLMQAGAKR